MKRFLLALLALLLSTQLSFAATCFWVGGTGTWDQTNTGGGGAGGIKWASTSGGGTACAATSGPAAGVPGASDNATFDANSGGGTVTVNFGGTVLLTNLTMGAFTGTWDNSVNNNNFTISGTGMSITGTGTRTIRLGSATYTLSSVNASFDGQTTTNLTLVGGTSNINFTGDNSREIRLGTGATLPTVTVGASGAVQRGPFTVHSSTSGTFTNFVVNPPNYVVIGGTSLVVTNPITWVGTPSAPIGLVSGIGINLAAQVNLASGSTITWASVRDFAPTASGRLTCTNCMDQGNTTNITFVAISSGGGGCVFGGWLLWGDITGRGHDNDNVPVWLDKAG